MAFNIGVNVVEVDGSAAPALVGAAVSVGAFNLLTQRGVPNRPARVTSFPKFVEQFGSYFDGGLGAYLVKGFFDNGGQVLYVNRVVDTTPVTGALASSVTLQDDAPADTLMLEAGFRGTEDPGTWGDQLFVRTTRTSLKSTRVLETAPATIQSTVLAEPIDMSSFPALSVMIDGSPTPTAITFQASDFPNAAQATLAQIRDAINRRTNRLVASIPPTNDRVVLTSTGDVARLSGAWSSLQVTADNTTLGFSLMASPTRGTPAPRSIGGTQLDKVESFEVGDALEVSDGALSARVKLLSLDPVTRAVSWSPDIANIATYDPFAITVSSLEFDLEIAQGKGDEEHVVETHGGLSMEPDLANYAPRVLNHALSGSRFVRAEDSASGSGVGANRPATLTTFSQLAGGQDGSPTANHFLGDQSAKTGFFAFDPFDVQLVCCERSDAAIVAGALAYCAGRGDCMFVGSVPEGYVEGGQAVAYGQSFQTKKAYGALYGPWITVADPIGIGPNPLKNIPPTGHVIGVYARIETTRGIWKAPAGDEANLLGALGVTYRLSDAEHTDLVKNGSVNGVRAIPGAGIVIDASRTLSTDTRWLYVNVRLLFNYVKTSLRQGLRFARQEPNRDSLWSTLKFGTVTPFLMRLWRQGAFGTGSPEQVFTVVIDASNNPPSQVDQGILTLEVYFYPSRPAETIVIMVGQQGSGAEVSEA
jgi:phage tail sheath protein FI